METPPDSLLSLIVFMDFFVSISFLKFLSWSLSFFRSFLILSYIFWSSSFWVLVLFLISSSICLHITKHTEIFLLRSSLSLQPEISLAPLPSASPWKPCTDRYFSWVPALPHTFLAWNGRVLSLYCWFSFPNQQLGWLLHRAESVYNNSYLDSFLTTILLSFLLTMALRFVEDL